MRMNARSAVKTTVVAILTALAALIIGVTQTLTTAVTASLGLTAFQALIVPGTGTPHAANDYLDNAVNYYIVPGANPACSVAAPAGPCPTTQGIDYFATFWPIPLPGWGGLEGQKWNVSVASGVQDLNGKYDGIIANPALDGQQIEVFGYSQGATVASNFKRLHSSDPWDIKARTDYFYIGNPQKPNGGFFERLAYLGNVPILDAQFGDPSPTDTCTDENGALRTCATDFALMYDGVVDFPEWLLNVPALLNAVAGFQYVHGTYLAPNGDDPSTETPYGYSVEEVQGYVAAATAANGCTAANYCQQPEGSDTIYVVLPARYLPIYQPFIDIGDATGTSALVVPITDFLSPFTQTIIETGYNRTNYSTPTPGTLLPPATFNPIQTAVDLVNDIPEGINMALTPGRTPLPDAPPLPPSASALEVTSGTNQLVANTTTPQLFDGKPLVRLGLIAKPGEGVTAAGTNGSGTDRPLRNALKDFHPVRDVVKAVSGTVKNVVGKKDDSAAGSETE